MERADQTGAQRSSNERGEVVEFQAGVRELISEGCAQLHFQRHQPVCIKALIRLGTALALPLSENYALVLALAAVFQGEDVPPDALVVGLNEAAVTGTQPCTILRTVSSLEPPDEVSTSEKGEGM